MYIGNYLLLVWLCLTDYTNNFSYWSSGVIVTTAALLLIILWKCKRTTEGTARSTSDCSTTVTYNNCYSRLNLLFSTFQLKPPEENFYTTSYVYKQY